MSNSESEYRMTLEEAEDPYAWAEAHADDDRQALDRDMDKIVEAFQCLS